LPFENGQEFNDFQHITMIWIFWWAFSFQNLNRTATYIGKKTSWTITSFSSNTEIIENQEAVRAFQNRLASRFLAFAKISQDSKTSYETLLRWNTFDSIPLSSLLLFVRM
jgi:ribonuclease HIII